MTRLLLAYVATLVIFCIVDFIWLGLVAKGFYQSEVGALLLAQPNWTVAILFYALYVAGVVFFAVAPALEAESWVRALTHGALFGLFAYATYDLTNLATLKGWSGTLALVDIGWGAVVTGAAAVGGYAVTRLSTVA